MKEFAIPPAHLAARARRYRLLIERLAVTPSRAVELTVSGREADLRAFVAAVEAGRPPAWFVRWKLSALGGGSVRLDGRIEGTARSFAVQASDARLLFATSVAAPVAVDAPALAGIVGRLPDNAVALVRGEGGRAVTVTPGGQAPGGWRLEALSADTAVFVRGQQRARVPLPDE